eukprot:CAMPEP_0184696460 /NCGR_PEP_ID=MMETSP0313-20130426/3744_1 /TAXON_ID=2792 /ORGANISM="Porphyridium aerugineum, Strain SAG 1380-2" /LENGTH=339 /DNA_ID=CAMNT_0027155087 /DNA_START=141 /DNA_END=1160 /DNA_ORIENTATION=+
MASVAGGEALVDGLAGICGGVVALVTTYPLLTHTTRVQTGTAASTTQHIKEECQHQHEHENEKKEKEKDGDESDSLKQKPSQSLVRRMVSLEVIRENDWLIKLVQSYFAGLKPALIGTICAQGSYYYFYSLFRRLATGGSELSRKHSLSLASSLLVSSLAGCINVLLNNPIWVVVTRMQASNTSFWSTVRDMYNEDGIASMFKGLVPALLMVSNPVVQFALLEYMTKLLVNHRKTHRLSATELVLLGGLAKLGATVICYPMHTVKSVLQVSGKGKSNPQHYKGSVDALQQLWAKNGIREFYRGMQSKIAQSVLAAALLHLVRQRIQLLSKKVIRSVMKA